MRLKVNVHIIGRQIERGFKLDDTKTRQRPEPKISETYLKLCLNPNLSLEADRRKLPLLCEEDKCNCPV